MAETQTLVTSVYGGGGSTTATIQVTLDAVPIFTSTSTDAFHLDFAPDHTSVDTIGGTLYITVFPPESVTSMLTIVFTGALEKTLAVRYIGETTASGYNYSDTSTITETPGEEGITLGNILYAPVTYYYADLDSHSIVQTITDDVFMIPYLDLGATMPETGAVILAGFTQTLFTEWCDAVPGLQMGGNIKHNKYDSDSDYDLSLFLSYFPRFFYLDHNEYSLCIENKNTGVFIVETPNGANIYASKSDFTSGGSAITQNTSAFYDILKSDIQAGSSEHKGHERVLCYTSVDEATGNLTNFAYVNFDGLIGTRAFVETKTIYATGVSYPVDAFVPKLQTFFGGMSQYEPPSPESGDDPYDSGYPNGTSGAGGGDGTFDFESTDIPIPGLPTISATDTGFLTLYNPSAAQLKSLGNYMWSGAFDINNFKKLFADPMEAILGLHIIPVVSGHPATTSNSLSIGNVDTGISMPKCTEQYYELDCGTIEIKPKWGAYLDYSPYSKLSLFLPYIGFVPISPDDCMSGSIKVVYHVDILSGACCAYVYCYSNRGKDGHTLYTYTGACACDCPVTEGQYTNAVLGILNIATGVAGAIASGLTGNVGGVMGGLSSAANTALSMGKPEISRSGSFGGSAGLMGIQYPYLVLTIPKQCTPENQNKYIGYPSFVTKRMEFCKGYTEINVTHLENMSCTDAECSEIIDLLSGGVIF